MSNVEQFEILVLGAERRVSTSRGRWPSGSSDRDGRTGVARRVMPEHRVPAQQEPDPFGTGGIAGAAWRRIRPRDESLAVSMKDVQRRKRLMVDGLHRMHVARTVASGVELIMGEAGFAAPEPSRSLSPMAAADGSSANACSSPWGRARRCRRCPASPRRIR